MFLGSCELLISPMFVPKAVAGAFRFTWLKALTKSVRNWNLILSVTRKSFCRLRSISAYPDPRSGPCAGQLPNCPVAGAEYALASNHWEPVNGPVLGPRAGCLPNTGAVPLQFGRRPRER